MSGTSNRWVAVVAAMIAMGCGGATGGGGTTPGGSPPGSAPAHFFLPTAGQVRNTAGARIATDSAGQVHMVYPGYTTGDAFYAQCADDCQNEDQVKSVRLPTDGTVYNAMIAIGSDNQPRVLLSTMNHIYFGVCTGDCTQDSGWSLRSILEIGGIREVTGEAFALTSSNGPRFVMHTYRAYLGVDQKPSATFYVACDSGCDQAASWRSTQIANQIWQESSLVMGASDVPRFATVATVEDGSAHPDIGVYVECVAANCEDAASWKFVTFVNAFSDRHVAKIDQAISMVLDHKGATHVVMLGLDAQGARNMTYAECATNCTAGTSWAGGSISNNSKLDAGLDIAVNAKNDVFISYTIDGNIFVSHCAAGQCTGSTPNFKLDLVEGGQQMKADEIMPYPNCNVGMWFLRHPSMVLSPSGQPRVAYQAMDMSGGWTNPDQNAPKCAAGLDMTFARYTQMSGLSN